MIDTYEIYEELVPNLGDAPAGSIARVVGKVYRDLSQAVTRDDFNRLVAIVGELAEAQKKTEERLDILSQRVEELAEAQKRTEQRLDVLTEKVEFLHERVEDLSDSVGYSIENRAYQALPSLLEKHGIVVQRDLIRRYIGEHQINVFGKARRENQDVTILGECKTRLSKKEMTRFERIVNRLKREGKVDGEIVTIFIAHDFPPEVEAHLMKKKTFYFWSYQFK